MKILYVCHRFPFPPKRGGKIRPFNMIKHFRDSGHQVTVASIARSAREAKEGEGLGPYCHEYLLETVSSPAAALRMVGRLPTMTPSSMGFFYSPRLAARIRSTLEANRYDLVFVHCSSMAQYVVDVADVPKILDLGDVDSQKWLAYGRIKKFPLSLGYYLEGLKLQLAEMDLMTRFDTCTCTTRAEHKTLEGFLTGARTDWFPNGVDAETFRSDGSAYDPDTICFVGRMDYYPNQECMFDFCANVLPLIHAVRPETKLVIVGADPSPQVRKLGRLRGVSVTGSVPDVRPYLQRAAVSVAPLNIARGTQNKILESLAIGVPNVCSELAVGGVDVVAGEHLLAARTSRGYADAVLRILGDPAERQRLAEAGRKRVLSHHSWANSMKKLDGIIEECLAAATGESRQQRRAVR